jgi:hypothetical protein
LDPVRPTLAALEAVLLDQPALLELVELPVDGRPRQRPDRADLAGGLELLYQPPAVNGLLGQ